MKETEKLNQASVLLRLMAAAAQLVLDHSNGCCCGLQCHCFDELKDWSINAGILADVIDTDIARSIVGEVITVYPKHVFEGPSFSEPCTYCHRPSVDAIHAVRQCF